MSDSIVYIVRSAGALRGFALWRTLCRVIMPWQGILRTLASWTRAHAQGHARAKCLPSLAVRLVGHCGFLWFWISCWYILLVWWYGHAWNKKFRNLFLPIFNNILIINILMFKLNTSKKKQNYTLDIAFLAAVRCGVTSTFLGRSFDHMRSGGRIYARCGAGWNVPHLPNCLANCRISGKTHPLLLLMFGSANEIQWTS